MNVPPECSSGGQNRILGSEKYWGVEDGVLVRRIRLSGRYGSGRQGICVMHKGLETKFNEGDVLS